MADDLRHFLAGTPPQEKSASCREQNERCGGRRAHTGLPAPATASDSRPVTIVPKGLRSFDAQDADFFLELLPGPRDRDGLPDSIRFWKIPHRGDGRRRHFCRGPDLRSVGLRQVVAGEGGLAAPAVRRRDRRLRRGDGRGNGSAPAERPAEAVSGPARRPGVEGDAGGVAAGAGPSGGQEGADRPGPVRAVAARREAEQRTRSWYKPCGSATAAGCSASSWCATTSGWPPAAFFKQLEVEIRLLEGQNSAAVDLFDLDHARKVLAAFGRAFGKTRGSDWRIRQGTELAFLNQAVAGLSQEDKVVCVRLALFAEMMKGKPWTPAAPEGSRRRRGRRRRVPGRRLFCDHRPTRHRLHQKAARAVLQASAARIRHGHQGPHAV